MYDDYTQALTALRDIPSDELSGDKLAEALSFLNQCNAPLSHKGPVEIALTSPTGADETYAPLALYNYAGGGASVNGIPQEGTAMYVGAGNILLNGGGVVSLGTTTLGGAGTRFVNQSGEIIPRGGIMRITGVSQLPVVVATKQRRQILLIQHLTVAKPNATFQRLYAINGANDVAIGGTGYCSLSGLGTALYDSAQTPGEDQSWGAITGTWNLIKGRPGFTIIGVTDSTLKQVAVYQEPVNEVLGFTQGACAKGASGPMELWFPDPGDGAAGGESISEYTLSPYNKYADLGDDKWTGAYWRCGFWYFNTKEC